MRSNWPRRSRRRFRALIMPGVATGIGLLIMIFTPVPTLGRASLLGGLAALVIAGLIAAVSF